MTLLVTLSVVVVVLLVAGLAGYLYVVGSQLARVADNLEACADLVWQIHGHAEVIEPGLHRINRTAGTVAGALPLLYTAAEGVVTGATYEPDPAPQPSVARPASGVRRSRLLDAVGYRSGA